MKITKYGIVAISEDDVMATGFTVDGQMPGNWLPPHASELIITWAIERLKEVSNVKEVEIDE